MYSNLEGDAAAEFWRVGYQPLVGLDGPELLQAIGTIRHSELSWLSVLAVPSKDATGATKCTLCHYTFLTDLIGSTTEASSGVRAGRQGRTSIPCVLCHSFWLKQLLISHLGGGIHGMLGASLDQIRLHNLTWWVQLLKRRLSWATGFAAAE